MSTWFPLLLTKSLIPGTIHNLLNPIVFYTEMKGSIVLITSVHNRALYFVASTTFFLEITHHLLIFNIALQSIITSAFSSNLPTLRSHDNLLRATFCPIFTVEALMTCLVLLAPVIRSYIYSQIRLYIICAGPFYAFSEMFALHHIYILGLQRMEKDRQ